MQHSSAAARLTGTLSQLKNSVALKEVTTTGREISTTKEGTITTLAGDLIRIKIRERETAADIIHEENTLKTITAEKEGATISSETILVTDIATVLGKRATINVILTLNMKRLITRGTITLLLLSTSVLVKISYTNIPIRHQDSTTSLVG